MEMRNAARVARVSHVAEQRSPRDDLAYVEIRRVAIEMRVEEEHRALTSDEHDLASARLYFDARDDAPGGGAHWSTATREEVGALMRAVKAGTRRVEVSRNGGVRNAVDGDGKRRRGRRVRGDEHRFGDEECSQTSHDDTFRSHP